MEKIAPPGDPKDHPVEDNHPTQLMEAWWGNFNSEPVRTAVTYLAEPIRRSDVAVQVRNVSFEWVPPELVDVYVTEVGLWTVGDISRRSQMLGAEQDRFFGDL